MKTIYKTIAAIVFSSVLLSVSSIASANPLEAPNIYNNGPASPRVNSTNLRNTERAAYSLAEALMQATESLVYVKGCQEFTVPVEIYSHPDSNEHFIEDKSRSGITLYADIRNPVPGFGQHIDVKQDYLGGFLNDTPVRNVRGRYSYNSKNSLMINKRTRIQVEGQLGFFDNFTSSVIKDFYHGDTYDSNGDFHVMYDYGLQSLSKYGFPVNKWWQKSKSVRDNGQQGCFVLQKDRLVGVSVCRITLATTGVSQPGLFWQDGTLKVEKVMPSADEPALNDCGINPIF